MKENSTLKKLRPMAGLGVIYASFATMDMLIANVLPLTLRHFTDSVLLISIMIGAKRLGGVFVQPYIAWKSDYSISKSGRRRPFLLAGIVGTLISMLLLGSLPHILPRDMIGGLTALIVVFVVDIVMDFFLSVCFGSIEPLYGDTFKKDELGKASAIRHYIVVGQTLFMGYVAIPLADTHEIYPYIGAAVCLLISLLVAWKRLREVPVSAVIPSRQPYAPWRQLSILKDPSLAYTAIIATCALGVVVSAGLLQSLFATETIGLTKTDFGHAITIGAVCSFIFAYPAGWFVDKLGPAAVMKIGFLATFVQMLGSVFWVNDRSSFFLMFAVGAFCIPLLMIPVTAITFARSDEQNRGTIFGAIQTVRAAMAALLTLVTGELAETFGSYRLGYVVAAACCIIGLFAALRLPPKE